MPQVSKLWECPQCHTKYTNLITTERLDGKAGVNSVPYPCLNCGYTTFIAAKNTETIVSLKTFPEGES